MPATVADAGVQSVAGIEVAYNAHANLLTRLSSIRQVAWQMTQCCVCRCAGNVLVNRGTFAMYRAPVIRDNLDLYLNEKFLGKQVRYSDDSLLTLFALKPARAVQPLTAFRLPMYPENVGHALRQWVRWMRGSPDPELLAPALPARLLVRLADERAVLVAVLGLVGRLPHDVRRPAGRGRRQHRAGPRIVLLSSYLVALRNR